MAGFVRLVMSNLLVSVPGRVRFKPLPYLRRQFIEPIHERARSVHFPVEDGSGLGHSDSSLFAMLRTGNSPAADVGIPATKATPWPRRSPWWLPGMPRGTRFGIAPFPERIGIAAPAP